MYDLHHGLLMIVCYAVEMGIIKVVESQISPIARRRHQLLRAEGYFTSSHMLVSPSAYQYGEGSPTSLRLDLIGNDRA